MLGLLARFLPGAGFFTVAWAFLRIAAVAVVAVWVTSTFLERDRLRAELRSREDELGVVVGNLEQLRKEARGYVAAVKRSDREAASVARTEKKLRDEITGLRKKLAASADPCRDAARMLGAGEPARLVAPDR